ncbi:MAG: YvrJ family protein [Thermicanus sp.]|nr:YvrJ family protein [Thermicanus sp.]
MTEWASLLANLGFPIVVTFYLLTRIEGKLESLDETIRQLSQTIHQLKG